VSDQLFIVLRVCLLALVYLVFLRVLRAVWMETRAEVAPARLAAAPISAPRPMATAAAPAVALQVTAAAPTTVPSPAARLVVLAPPSIAGHAFAVDGETTIGRAHGCAVAIDDAHISKLHARVSPDGDGWILEDLGSTNGTLLDGEKVTAPTPIDRGNKIMIGEIVLEFV